MAAYGVCHTNWHQWCVEWEFAPHRINRGLNLVWPIASNAFATVASLIAYFRVYSRSSPRLTSLTNAS